MLWTLGLGGGQRIYSRVGQLPLTEGELPATTSLSYYGTVKRGSPALLRGEWTKVSSCADSGSRMSISTPCSSESFLSKSQVCECRYKSL